MQTMSSTPADSKRKGNMDLNGVASNIATDNSRIPPKKKKRKRISLTCNTCRARKIKCDQGKPCSSCVKKKIPAHLCIYELSPFIPKVDESSDPMQAILLLKKENEMLKEEVSNLQKLNGITPVPTDSREDRVINLPETILIKKNRLAYNGPTNWKAILQHDKQHEEEYGIGKAYLSNARREWKHQKNFKRLPYEEYKEVQAITPHELLSNLANYLPDFETVKSYIHIYLNSYWNYSIPVLESISLLSDFYELFIKDYDSRSFKIVVHQKSVDYAKISTILLAIKFVASTLNASGESEFDRKDLLIRYSERLLEYSRCQIRLSIPTLQSLILLQQLKKINPVEGNTADGANGVLVFKAAINMAILLGFHRDIDKLYAHESTSKRKTYKETWQFLIRRDSYISFNLGIPPSIDDIYFIDGDKNSPDMLTLLIRESSKLFTNTKGCKVSEVLDLIQRLENFRGGELTNLSDLVKTLNTSDDALASFDKIAQIEQSVIAIYTLHVLYVLLFIEFRSDYDYEKRSHFYTGNIKFGILSVAHMIELLLRFNIMCIKSSKQDDKAKFLNIVEISLSFTSLASTIFISTFCCLCSHIVKSNTPTSNGSDPQEIVSVSVDDIERLDITDSNGSINKVFKKQSFILGLLTLACKHVLRINNESFGHVFDYNFCLYAVVSLYKCFDQLLKIDLPKDALDPTSSMKTNFIYVAKSKKAEHGSSVKTAKETKPVSESTVLKDSDETFHDSIPNSTISETPSTSAMSVGTNLEFDFFEWRNEEVDKLFNNILLDDSLFSLNDEHGGTWNLDNFVNNNKPQ